MKNILLIILILPLILGTTYQLSWTPPITNTDGSPLTDLAGYKFYCSVDGATLNSVKDLPDPTANTGTMEGCLTGYGEEMIAITAYNSIGTESPFSNVVKKNYPPPKVPAAPLGLVVVEI